MLFLLIKIFGRNSLMADFDEMKNAMYNAIHPDNKIPLSSRTIQRFINEWGPEVILRCRCHDWPSHSLWGQKGYGRCGSCNEICKPIFESWSTAVE
jgi:hypothetical protein